jgi:hypothetical protein
MAPSQLKVNWHPLARFRSLIDHAAHAVGIAGVHHAVEHDLRHRLLPGIGLHRRFIIDRGRQALQRARLIDRRSRQRQTAHELAPGAQARLFAGQHRRAWQHQRSRIVEIVEGRTRKILAGAFERHAVLGLIAWCGFDAIAALGANDLRGTQRQDERQQQPCRPFAQTHRPMGAEQLGKAKGHGPSVYPG